MVLPAALKPDGLTIGEIVTVCAHRDGGDYVAETVSPRPAPELSGLPVQNAQLLGGSRGHRNLTSASPARSLMSR
jgi:hypothetical protein